MTFGIEPYGLTDAHAAARVNAEQGSMSLLRAQLRAGQHLLLYADAVRLGQSIGLNAVQVKPAAGDHAAHRMLKIARPL